MQINKPKKQPRRQSSNTLFDNDFAAGFEDSKLDKFKPAIKVFIVIIVLMTAVWGVSAYFGSTDTENSANKDYTSNSTVEQTEDDDSKLSQCLSNASASSPAPDATDGDFWPKLIAGYDAQLACYDEYPDATGSISRSSTESARQDAIDSSGAYKDTYLSSNSYTYTPSSNPSTSSSGRSGNDQPQSNNTQPTESTSTPSEWELNETEFNTAAACANNAAANNPIQGAYGSPSYYQQKIAQLEAQLACTNGAKYSLTQQRRASYQSQIATNKARYNDSINPDSSSYYPNSY